MTPKWALLAVALCASCKHTDVEPAPKPADLHMVSAGNEPRRLVRYHAPKGQKQALEVAIDLTLEADQLGGPLPTVVMNMLIAVEAVVPTGAMQLHTTLVDATARERDDSKVPAATMSGPLEQLKGVALTSTLSPNGRLSKPTVEGGKQLREGLNQQLGALTGSFEQVMMPLPDQPIGVGAVWRNSKPIEQNGMKLTAVNTIAVTKLDGDKLTFRLDTEIHGDDQTVQQGGTPIELKNVTGTGIGTGTVDLATLAVTSELTAELRSDMTVPGEAKPTRMSMRSVTRVTPR